MTDLHRPALLDLRRHDRTRFQCGEPILDEWLHRYAGQSRRRDTAATWVITDADQVVVASASIAMTSIDRSAAPAGLARQAPDPVPALLLGRLAVDRCYVGLGLGTELVAHVLATAVEFAVKLCRAVVVTSLNAEVRRWWERLGFLRSTPTTIAPLTCICSPPTSGDAQRDALSRRPSGASTTIERQRTCSRINRTGGGAVDMTAGTRF